VGEGRRSVESFAEVWIDLCFCSVCDEYVWHVEAADTHEERDGHVSRCPDCGGRLALVLGDDAR